MDNTNIAWTNHTWNPTRGCSIVSPGCKNCYAMKFAHRYSGPGLPYEGLTKEVNGHPVWNGEIKLVPHMLKKPRKWERDALKSGKPPMVFVDSMSDLFHEEVPSDYIDQVFDAMEAAPHVIFQILTKRPNRMGAFMVRRLWDLGVRRQLIVDKNNPMPYLQEWAEVFYPNIWLGTSVERQREADSRIPALLRFPAAVHFLSCEPLLGPVSLKQWLWKTNHKTTPEGVLVEHLEKMNTIDWVIVGGESGPDRREMSLNWAYNLYLECLIAKVPFFFKQTSGPRSGMNPEALGGIKREFPAIAKKLFVGHNMYDASVAHGRHV